MRKLIIITFITIFSLSLKSQINVSEDVFNLHSISFQKDDTISVLMHENGEVSEVFYQIHTPYSFQFADTTVNYPICLQTLEENWYITNVVSTANFEFLFFQQPITIVKDECDNFYIKVD
ncbi:MAG: hypothetical protein H6552_00340 [Chitinophagales bacterium]|nr:hypothetical protein [Chitinophagales bacterium]